MSPLSRRRFVSQLPATATAGAALAALSAPSPSHAQTASAPSGLYNVRDYGARGDGTTLDTAALQAAIDAASGAGGGTVLLPPGVFLSGTLTLRDRTTLHISTGATLLGSPQVADYPAKPFGSRDLDIGGFDIWTLLYAAGASDIAIEGHGVIDGNGRPFPPREKIQPLDVASGPRPRGVFFKDCKRVTLRDVRIVNAAMWAVHLALCDGALLDGLKIESRFFVQQDGIVLDSSRHVRVQGCVVDTIDDALIFKSSFPRPCEHITVTGCVLTCRSSAIKFGTQSLGGFRDIAISNCACHDCRLGGLKFEAVDGGMLEDVTVSNITMTNVSAPLFFKIGNRARNFGFEEVPQPQPIGALRNVVITGLRARLLLEETLFQGGSVTPADRKAVPYRIANTIIIGGLPGHPVENVSLSDIHITCPGGGTAEDAARTGILEQAKRYPENDMLGILPAWGFYIRHARGITLDNVRLDLAQPDRRCVVLAEDVADLEITGLKAATHGEHFLRLRDVRTATVRGSRPLDPVPVFAEVAGATSADIALLGNDLRNAAAAVLARDGFTGAVAQEGNLSRTP